MGVDVLRVKVLGGDILKLDVMVLPRQDSGIIRPDYGIIRPNYRMGLECAGRA